MDYKEKYEQALEKARELMGRGYDVLMPEIFPELQESEDEKVRREIRNFIWEYPDKLPERTRWLAWFEKQEEKNINHNIDIKEKAHQIAWETSKDYDPLLSRESWCEMAALDMASRLEKQGEHSWKPTEEQLEALDYAYNNCSDTERGNYYECVLADLIANLHKLYEKQDEQKPTDKTKPKFKVEFKVGDWIVGNEGIFKITQYEDEYGYELTNITGCVVHFLSPNYVESNFHLWTIEDAKDGDVLTNGKIIVIFKQIVEPKYKQHIEAYIGLDLGCDIQVTSESWSLGIDKAMPATKEQRDMLFQKMKEARYEWDAEKKEVKTIEQNPLESTKDYNDIDPHFGIPVEDLMSIDKTEPKFKVGDWVLNNVCFPMQIASIKDGMYVFTEGDAMSVLFIDGNYHLWTIQDAMDGDVLINWNNTTFIFKAIEDGTVKFHIAYNEKLNTIKTPATKLSHQGLAEPEFEFNPATKEQRDLLFQKMKESGYEWDADRKKLKKIEQKSADKTESKFKVGNWYQCIKNFFGKGVTFDKDTAYYCAMEGCLLDGCHIAIVKDLYDNFKLWTIADAKEGDVLATDVSVFIYAKVLYNKPYAYCGVDKYGVFKDNCLENDWSNSVDNIHPATKEQRDTLFAKMADAGYEWDADKKELKKIESKTLDVWNAEDEQNLNVVLSFIPDECLRRWLKDKLCYDTLDANKVIEWLDKQACLGWLEDVEVEKVVEQFKKDFGL